MNIFRIVCAAVACEFVIAAGGFGSDTMAQTGARVQVLSQTDTTMSLKFFDKHENHHTVSFARSDSESLWRGAGLQNVDPGIIFGNTQPRFAGPARQRAAGISPQQAITTLDSSITGRPMDDITIYYLGAGDMAIGLWQNGAIMEIHYVGALVVEVMWIGFQQWNFCQRLKQLCCRKIEQPPPPFGLPDIPKPNVAACRILAKNCGMKQDACDCLNYACDFCFEHPAYCCGEEPPPDPEDPNAPGPCPWPWLPADSEAACVAGGEICVEPPDEDEEVDAVFEEIANRLQVIVDLQNNS